MMKMVVEKQMPVVVTMMPAVTIQAAWVPTVLTYEQITTPHPCTETFPPSLCTETSPL